MTLIGLARDELESVVKVLTKVADHAVITGRDVSVELVTDVLDHIDEGCHTETG